MVRALCEKKGDRDEGRKYKESKEDNESKYEESKDEESEFEASKDEESEYEESEYEESKDKQTFCRHFQDAREVSSLLMQNAEAFAAVVTEVRGFK